MQAGWTRRQALTAMASVTLPAQVGLAAEAGPPLRRGINLHNLLNWPDVSKSAAGLAYTWPPFGTEGYKMRTGEFQSLRAAGFDFVRVTVDPSIFLAVDASRRTTLNDIAKATVDRLLASGFAVVFDLHPVAVNPAWKPEALVDPASPEAFNRYAEMVGRVATLLAAYPADKVAFELMNEPQITRTAELKRWQPMLEKLHAAAREKAPRLPLVLSGALWSDYRALLRVDTAPFRSSNVLYTFHYYDPHTFTHQGVKGDETRHLAGLEWPETKSHAEAVLRDAADRIAADPQTPPSSKAGALAESRKLMADLLAGTYDAAHVDKDFAEVARWGAANDVPNGRIILGEFGCVEAANGRAVGGARLAWLKTVRMAAERLGMPWAYWVYKGYGGMQLIGGDGRIDPTLTDCLGLA